MGRPRRKQQLPLQSSSRRCSCTLEFRSMLKMVVREFGVLVESVTFISSLHRVGAFSVEGEMGNLGSRTRSR